MNMLHKAMTIAGSDASGGKGQGRHQTLQFHALLLAGRGCDGTGPSICRPHEDSMTGL